MPPCDVPLASLDRSMDGAGGAWTYRYRVEAGASPDLPPVVVVPGGPGVAAVAAGRSAFAIPAAYTVVTTELRGVGCNRVEPRPASWSDLRVHAEDLVAVLDALDRPAVVYGHSFGTVLATMAVSLAEQRGVAVEGLVLEGVVGGPFQGDAAFGAYQTAWDHLLDGPHGASLRARLHDGLGLDPSDWGTWAYLRLPVGGIPSTLGEGDYVVTVGSYGARRFLRRDVRSAVAENAPDPDVAWAVPALACRSLADHLYDAATLVDDRLVPVDDLCPVGGVTTPYDPAAWPIRSPITYLLGELDPATPLAQALVHVDAMSGAERTVVTVRAGGHQPSAFNLAGCGDDFWRAATSAAPFDPAGCRWPITSEVRPAVQGP